MGRRKAPTDGKWLEILQRIRRSMSAQVSDRMQTLLIDEAELAKRLDVTTKYVRHHVVHPDPQPRRWPNLATAAQVADALDCRVEVRLVPLPKRRKK